jgi:hypothetical protein
MTSPTKQEPVRRVSVASISHDHMVEFEGDDGKRYFPIIDEVFVTAREHDALQATVAERDARVKELEKALRLMVDTFDWPGFTDNYGPRKDAVASARALLSPGEAKGAK